MKNSIAEFTNYSNGFNIWNKIYRLIWNFIFYLFFRPFTLPIFRKWRIFVLNIFGAKIHYSSLVHASARIWAPYNLEMKRNAVIGREVDCYNQGKITLLEKSIVSQKSYLCASSHDITDPNNSLIVKPIIIGEKSWVAADAFIGPGVKIGQGAVVGARASVFKDVAPWTVVGGNPAKFIKKREIKNAE